MKTAENDVQYSNFTIGEMNIFKSRVRYTPKMEITLTYLKEKQWHGNTLLYINRSFGSCCLYIWAGSGGLWYVIFEILGRDISVIEYYKSFHWFFANILENKCNGILLNLRCMFDISCCDVIYYVIYVNCSHYVRKAINPLFAWPSSIIYN